MMTSIPVNLEWADDYADMTAQRDAAIARAEAAERRVAELEAAFEWRPVTGDDLPEDHDEALVTVENEDGYRFVDMAEFTVGGVWWQRVDTGWQELKRVTHWRPLPPPPAATE